MGKPFAASRPLAHAKESAIVKRCDSYSGVSHKVQMSSSNLVGTPGSVGHTAPSLHLPCGPWVVRSRTGRYVSANTSSAFLSQPCPVSVEVISRSVLITSTGRTKGDGRMPATIASRYRLASPSATGMQSGLCSRYKLCFPSYSGRSRLRLFAYAPPR